MAAKTPTTLSELRAGTADSYVDPHGKGGDLNGTKVESFLGLKHQTWFFSDVGNNDSWTSNISGLVHVAFKATSAGTVDANIFDAASGLINFQASASNQTGILHTWSRQTT